MRGRTLFVPIVVVFLSVAITQTRAQDPCLNCARDAQNGDPWCEDFEVNSGPNPECYDTKECTIEREIPRGCNGWYLWWDDPVNAVNGHVDCVQNHTPGGEQSFSSNDTDDTVHFFGDGYDLATSYAWIMTVWVYIPSDMAGDAYFIVNPDYEIDGSGITTWAVVLRMNASDGTICNDFGNNACLPLVTDDWAEIRSEINFDADRVKVFYDDQFLDFYKWTEQGGSLQIRAIDLFSSNSTEHWYDDMSLCAAEIIDNLPPVLRCQTIDRLESGCVDYFFSLTNINAAGPIPEFYLDVEAGDGGQICTDIEDITPPAGWTAELCAGWSDGHALFRFSTDTSGIPVGGVVTGRVRVDPNGPAPTATPTGLDVPPFSVLMHAAQLFGNPDAACDGSFDFGPTTRNPIPCIDNTECADFGVKCVDGFCEGILRQSWWSSPTNVCTAFLPVPAMTSMAKVVLTALLIGGGSLLVLRGRRTHAAM